MLIVFTIFECFFNINRHMVAIFVAIRVETWPNFVGNFQRFFLFHFRYYPEDAAKCRKSENSRKNLTKCVNLVDLSDEVIHLGQKSVPRKSYTELSGKQTGLRYRLLEDINGRQRVVVRQDALEDGQDLLDVTDAVSWQCFILETWLEGEEGSFCGQPSKHVSKCKFQLNSA